MKQLILSLLITGVLCAQAIAAGDEEAALQADQALFQAIAKADTTAVRRALDGRLAWTVASQWELSVVGDNLFQPHHVEFDPTVGIKRSFYGKLVWRSRGS